MKFAEYLAEGKDLISNEEEISVNWAWSSYGDSIKVNPKKDLIDPSKDDFLLDGYFDNEDNLGIIKSLKLFKDPKKIFSTIMSQIGKSMKKIEKRTDLDPSDLKILKNLVKKF
jgi:hypothetical protein